MKAGKRKVLFVCTINRMRSATAHAIFQHDDRFEVKSAGTSPDASTVLTYDLLEWADVVLVMEKSHRNFIRAKFPKIYESKRIVCLYIPDEYEYMQPELITVLKHRVEDVHKKGLL
jgi:predicted protein tyrosine phosphatase